jgi:predicted RNA-binding Zn-ribbon protein involved in translation (DUF1610 family)
LTRTQFVEQLDELRARGRPVLFLGFTLILLAEFPLVLHFFSVVRRGEPHSPSTAYLGIETLATCLLIWAAFLAVLERVTAKYSPRCPACAKRITWRQRRDALNSGNCPRCGAALFEPS